MFNTASHRNELGETPQKSYWRKCRTALWVDHALFGDWSLSVIAVAFFDA